MSTRSFAIAGAGTRRALLVAAAAGAAAATAGSLGRPLGVRAGNGDPFTLGQGNSADATTSLESAAAVALSVDGATFGLSSTGGEYGITANTDGSGGWPRAIIANGNNGSTGVHAASWAGAGGPTLGSGDAMVAETATGKAVVAHAFDSGIGLDASSASGTGATIRSGSGTALVVESASGMGMSVSAAHTGMNVDAQGWGIVANSHHVGENSPGAIVGHGFNDGNGVVGVALATETFGTGGAGTGVHGSTGSGMGVEGFASVTGGVGVSGRSLHGTGIQATSDDGIGLDATGTQVGIHVSAPSYGLISDSSGVDDGAVAVLGHGLNDAIGVVGRCLAGTDFDVGGSNSGVSGDSGSGPGVRGVSESGAGIEGRSTSFVGAWGEGAMAGIYGVSQQAGVVGAARVAAESVVVPSKTGVYGYDPVDSGGRGVVGQAVAGYGVSGLATTGRGVNGQATSGRGVSGYATSGTALYATTPKDPGTDRYTGYALRAVGRVRLDQCAGVATIAANTKSIAVKPGIDLTATSAVVATLQGNPGGTTTVQRVSINATTDTFTIYLTANSTAAVKVAWHVFG